MGGEGMNKNKMIEQLEKNADALQDIFNGIESENNINNGPELINLSLEIRALYNQIFQMKYSYRISSETLEDA